MSTLIFSPRLKDIDRSENIPEDWNHRSLYHTRSGSDNWIEYCKEYLSDILSNDEFVYDAKEIASVICSLDFRSFISLGPGDGLKDYYVLSELAFPPEYIAVDVSKYFIENIAAKFGKDINFKFGMVADFEEELEFIVDSFSTSIEHPLLISILGNTFGTLDHYENVFINNLQKVLQPGDCVVIEVGLIKNEWHFNTDVSSLSLLKKIPFREMLIKSMSLKSQDSCQVVRDNFNERIGLKPGRSDVPGTVVYEFYDRQNDKKIFCLARYDWNCFIKWFNSFQESFEITNSKCFYYKDLNLGTGIVTLRRT